MLSLVKTIVDTGAMRTCYVARLVNADLKESDFKNKPKITLCGFIKGKNSKEEKNESGIVCYAYSVKQFKLGSIDLGNQTIWVTFDERVTDNVIGLDILNKVSFLQYGNTNTLSFFSSKTELNAYTAGTIQRKLNSTKDNKVFYVEFDSMNCYFNKSKIKKSKEGRRYIMIGNTVCFLT